MCPKMFPICGTKSQFDFANCFKVPNQCVSMSVTANVYAHICDPFEWNCDSIDRILKEGNRLYERVIYYYKANSRTTYAEIKKSRYFLSVEHFRAYKSYQLFGREVFLTTQSDACCYGPIRKTDTSNFLNTLRPLRKSLVWFFQRHQFGVLIAAGEGRAIFKRQKYFYLFDSHKKPATLEQYSSITKIESQLVTLIHVNGVDASKDPIQFDLAYVKCDFTSNTDNSLKGHCSPSLACAINLRNRKILQSIDSTFNLPKNSKKVNNFPQKSTANHQSSVNKQNSIIGITTTGVLNSVNQKNNSFDGDIRPSSDSTQTNFSDYSDSDTILYTDWDSSSGASSCSSEGSKGSHPTKPLLPQLNSSLSENFCHREHSILADVYNSNFANFESEDKLSKKEKKKSIKEKPTLTKEHAAILEFVENSRGNESCFFNNYEHNYERESAGKLIYKCALSKEDKKGCPARLHITPERQLNKTINEHNHPADIGRKHHLLYLNYLRERATKTDENCLDVIREADKKWNVDYNICSEESRKRFFRNHRRKRDISRGVINSINLKNVDDTSVHSNK